MKKKQIPLGVINGLFCVLLAIALGLAFIHVTGIPYRLEPFVDEMAMRNYQAVMHFLSPFVNEPFSLPDLSYSADGAQHFADCKSLFNGVYCLGLVSLVASGILFFILRKQNKRGFWLTSAGTTLIAPIVLSLYMAVDFDRVFVMFHKIFFNNNLWVFDPDMDPIIRILPKQFFMHCAVLIVLCIVLVALAEFVLWIRSNQIGISRTVPVGASLERV